ncbi:hypothetical protein [Mycobacterium palustre]|uniref:Terminase large subunit gp17-like C-terminal domain-containing protein n=1 Tax=Mycobacterium palustre TaxID=153971 RepID=A0A1X1ZTK9_9MYCO|nr:hypothetical protein [Mycobacterium palustre]MCV7101152.1 hypothetical protein [Mycobacterium palustre]ORW26880.1 hypothetical protein AWC19_03230 [Mycobacterium palustre]
MLRGIKPGRFGGPELDSWRLSVMPGNPVRTVVAIDPSDSGQGDAAGIIAASLTTEGVVVVHRDISKPLTPEQWARAAVELAIDTGASEIAVETYIAREGYLSVLNTTMRRYRLPHPIRATPWPPRNNRSGRGRDDAMAHSAKLIQGLETGTVRLVGHLPSFEGQATRWQATQHQPDCIAAAVIAHDVLTNGGQVSFVSPIDRARRGMFSEPPAWMTRRIGGG